MRKWILKMMITMLLAAPAAAQQIDLKSLDKFASSAKGTTRIDMDESMLKSATSFLNGKKADEGTARKSTEGMKGFYLRSYEFDKKGTVKLDDLKPLHDQLKSPAWTVFLQSKEADEQTEIWMHKTNGVADGMLLIAAEAEELTVINAIGVTNPADLAKIGGQLGSPKIEKKEDEN